MIQTNNTGSLGISAVILMISFILIAITTLSVLSEETNDNLSEEEIQQMLEEAIDPITKYIQIQDQVGKYYGEPHHQKIQKIAIMIKPLISDEIELSELTIKLNNGNNLIILSYKGDAAFRDTNDLFEHQIWDNLTENNFGIIATHDKDNSITDYNTINKNTDMAYIIIKLPENFYMKKGDTLTVTLFPSSGIQRTTILEAPLPMKKVVSL
jgi:archaellin